MPVPVVFKKVRRLIVFKKASSHEEIPLLLNKVYPAHEVVKVDYFLQGCPPLADAIWAALTALLTKQPLNLPYALVKYD